MIRMRHIEGSKRIEMAADREVQTDYQAHSEGYAWFIALMKWGTIISVITGAAVVVMISS